MIAGVVLAAGAGRRFGRRKQLAELNGRPLLEHVLRAMAAAPLDRVIVVLGADAQEVSRRVELHGAEPVICDRWEAGMSASLRTGIDAAGSAAALAIVLGDQPLISTEAIARVVTARGHAAAVRATYDGVPGHPVLLERELFVRARELRGDTGARALLSGVSVREVACDDLGSPDDVDTPEQLAQLGGRATWLARPRCTTRVGEARTALVVAQRVDRGPTTGMRQRAIFPVNDSQRFLWRTACAQSQFLNTEAARRLWSCLSRNQDPAS